MANRPKILVIGGGAAGYFGAIAAAQACPTASVTILEKGKNVLQKVRISGGGRCNLTHACFDPKELSLFYPRGQRELIGPFNRFQPGDTIAWFADRGVETKIEDDNRMFPVSDDSATIVNCLQREVDKLGIEVLTSCGVKEMVPPASDGAPWSIHTDQKTYSADAVLCCSGSSPQMWKTLGSLGHAIAPLAPSLFTFNCKDPRIEGLAGIAVPVEITLPDQNLEESGPLLITHWGMSGPAVLKLSAWGARQLKACGYQFKVDINWVNGASLDDVMALLKTQRTTLARQQPSSSPAFGLPSRLWKKLVEHSDLFPGMRWGDLSNQALVDLAQTLTKSTFHIKGKSTFKDEFVTCGGVELKEVNFKTMESKFFPGLYFAGEVLDIDAVTGGFNFQAAWTCSWIAGNAIGEQLMLDQ